GVADRKLKPVSIARYVSNEDLVRRYGGDREVVDVIVLVRAPGAPGHEDASRARRITRLKIVEKLRPLVGHGQPTGFGQFNPQLLPAKIRVSAALTVRIRIRVVGPGLETGDVVAGAVPRGHSVAQHGQVVHAHDDAAG